MAYTHADSRIIHATSKRFRCLAGEAIMAGDLVYMAGSTGIKKATQTTAASALTTAAWAVACESIASGGTGWCALSVEIKDPDTIGAAGAVTQGGLATTADIMAALYCGTAGEATSTAPTAGSVVIKQYVGYILSVDRAILAPGVAIVEAATA